MSKLKGKVVDRVEVVEKDNDGCDQELRIWFEDGSHIIVFGMWYGNNGEMEGSCDVDWQYWGKEEWGDYLSRHGDTVVKRGENGQAK